MKQILFQLLILVSLLPCTSRAGERHANERGKSDWAGADVAKVVACQFKGADEGAQEGPEGFTLITASKLDTKRLKELSTKSATLSSKQVATLLDATFSKTKHMAPAACYDPHHIFVFYGKNGKVLRIIEMCFECTTVVTVPALGEKQSGKHDFVALAHLAKELGLWSGGMTVDEYIKLKTGAE